MSDSNITKKALATALKDLMQTQPFEMVSVGEICEACELNRKSFYYHFKDKYDLVEWIFHSEFIATVSAGKVTDRWSFVRTLCDYFYRERAFYSKLLRLTGQNSFRQYFSEYLFQIVEHAFHWRRSRTKTTVFLFPSSAMPCLSLSSAGWRKVPKPRRRNLYTGCNSSPRPSKALLTAA